MMDIGIIIKSKYSLRHFGSWTKDTNSKLFPIYTIDFSNPKERKMHDDVVAMVDKMLKLQKKYHSTQLEHDKKLYKTQLDLLDQQIDSLVHNLYRLTDEEVVLVEEYVRDSNRQKQKKRSDYVTY